MVPVDDALRRTDATHCLPVWFCNLLGRSFFGGHGLNSEASKLPTTVLQQTIVVLRGRAICKETSFFPGPWKQQRFFMKSGGRSEVSGVFSLYL